MKILFVDQYGELGGAQQCLLDLMPAITAQRWATTVAAPTGPLLDRLATAGIPISPLDPGAYNSVKKSPADALRFFTRLPRLAARVRAESRNCDLVYINGPRLVPPAALARLCAPVIFHAHHYLQSASSRRLLGYALRSTRAHIVAVSRFVADSLAPFVDPQRITVIPPGVPDLSTPRTQPAIPQRIGIIGRIAPDKGQLDFLQAARLALREMPDLRFTICGAPMLSWSDYDRKVTAAAEGLPVTFTGWRDDLAQVFSTLDLLIVPSTAPEGFGRVVVESFSSQVPVLAYPAGAIPELITDNQTGFLTRTCTPESLAARLLDVLRTPALLPRVIASARQSWQNHFTLAHYRTNMLAALTRAAPC